MQPCNSILGEGSENTEPGSQMLPLLITVTHKVTINYAKVKMTSSDRRSSMSRWTVVHNPLEQVILKVTHSDRPSAGSLAHN